MKADDDFPGRRVVMLPQQVVSQAQGRALTNGVFPVSVGHFPHAEGILRERPEGADHLIVLYCTRGHGWCETGGHRYPVRSGDLLVLPSKRPHRYGAEKDSRWAIHSCHICGAWIEPFMEELRLGNQGPVIPIGESPQALVLFEELLKTLEDGYTPLHLLYASHTLAHLLATLVRASREGERGDTTPMQRVARTIGYMQQHLGEAIPLDTLASIANLSRSQYAALFKEQTGYPPIDYFIRLRMHRACQLLDTTDLNIKEIATAVGYEDPLYFSRVFRSVNEMAPAEYRRMRKG